MNNKDPKYKTGDFVRISKYKNIFAKGYVLNCSEEVLRLKKLKRMFRGHILLVILTHRPNICSSYIRGTFHIFMGKKFPMEFWVILPNNVLGSVNIGILPESFVNILRMLHALFKVDQEMQE